ncbi:TetR/AcrR family transcriptional regulator [Christensenellaceae bacterium OttesenSCG-928-K19]|nr:TetR/AcrR family transcriptional regulator [Christensenellaceae bacterium OttesenSCG-928-K19]
MRNKEMTKRQMQAIETKQKIHDAAFHLMNINGLQNVSIRDICDAAGVSTGTFYHYYASKDEVFTLSAAKLDEIAYAVFNNRDKSLPLGDQFVSLFLSQAKHIASRGSAITNYTLVVHLKNPGLEIFTRKRPFYGFLCQFIDEAQKAGTLSRDFPPEFICDMAQALFRGLWVDWCTENGAFDLASRTKSYLSTFIRQFLVDSPA